MIFEETAKTVNKFLLESDVIRYVEMWGTMDINTSQTLYYILEVAKKLDEFKGTEVELFVAGSNEMKRVQGKIGILNDWEHLCLTLASMLNICLFSKPHDFPIEYQNKLNDVVN